MYLRPIPAMLLAHSHAPMQRKVPCADGHAPAPSDLSAYGYSVPDVFASGPDSGRFGPGATWFGCDGTESHGNYSFGN
ncbi:MAG TPA: hypothetical protein V6C86_10040 [Oculatellaceae cyanobacterium]